MPFGDKELVLCLASMNDSNRIVVKKIYVRMQVGQPTALHTVLLLHNPLNFWLIFCAEFRTSQQLNFHAL
jgi:hypothetical protein